MVWDMQIDRGSTTLSVWTRSRGAYVYPLPGGVTPIHSNTYCDTNSNSHCNANFYADTETYTHTESCADAEAASYAAAAAVARNWQQI